MKKILDKKILSLFLCMVLVISMALLTTGCGGSPDGDAASEEKTEDGEHGAEILGEGNTQFDFTVVDEAGAETKFEIHTDKETVGDALLELELIDGEDGEYGLYVKSVNGVTADYDTDGVYWAFYVNDEYAQSGVDSTKITEGDSYAFKIEK